MDEMNDILILDEENIKDLIYEIRGQKVMLSFDLARIYGYSTKRFNEQVKNNKEKFDGFMFKLTSLEVNNCSRSKISTLNSRLGRGRNYKYAPYAFTEHGIYMLMTVLKGDLAIQQSRKLITYFKGMKDYIQSERLGIPYHEMFRLETQVNKNTENIKKTNDKLDLIMQEFVEPQKLNNIVIAKNERIRADLVYQEIYKKAKHNIVIVDDFISGKTLELLKSCNDGIEITLISDNKAKEKITQTLLEDFQKDKNIIVNLYKSKEMFHDRYIFIDYKEDNEEMYHSGASSKDAGNKITSILREEYPELYHPLIDRIVDSK